MSRVCGIDHSTIARWERGDVKPMPENLRKIAPFLGLPYEELMAATGYISGIPEPETGTNYPTTRKVTEKLNSLFKEQIALPYYQIHVGSVARIPLLATIRAETPITDLAPDEYVEVPMHIHADFAVRMSDDGMSWAGITEGDIAVCRDAAAMEVRSGQMVAASLAEAGWEVTIKFYVEQDDQKLLRSANPSHKDTPLDGKEYRIAGVVVKFLKEPPTIDEYQRFLTDLIKASGGWASLLTQAAGVGLSPDDLKKYVETVKKASRKTRE